MHVTPASTLVTLATQASLGLGSTLAGLIGVFWALAFWLWLMPQRVSPTLLTNMSQADYSHSLVLRTFFCPLLPVLVTSHQTTDRATCVVPPPRLYLLP